MDVVRFDEIGDLAPLRAEHAPVVLVGGCPVAVGAAAVGLDEVGVMDVTVLVGFHQVVEVGSRLADPGHRTDPADERIGAVGGKQFTFEPGLLFRAHHGFLRRVLVAHVVALRSQIAKDELHPSHRKGLVDGKVIRAGGQRVMWDIFVVRQPRRFARRSLAVAVIAAVVVVVPNIDERHAAIKLRLLRGSEHAIVSRAEERQAVGLNVQVMKIPHVHEKQRLALADAVKPLAGRTGPRARRERDLERGRSRLGEGAKLAPALMVEPPVDFERVVVRRIGQQPLQRERDQIVMVRLAANRPGINRAGQLGIFAEGQPRDHPFMRDLRLDHRGSGCHRARPRPAVH